MKELSLNSEDRFAIVKHGVSPEVYNRFKNLLTEEFVTCSSENYIEFEIEGLSVTLFKERENGI